MMRVLSFPSSPVTRISSSACSFAAPSSSPARSMRASAYGMSWYGHGWSRALWSARAHRWDALPMQTRRCLQRLYGHDDGVLCVHFDARHIVSGSYDKTLIVWDRASGSAVRRLVGHDGWILCVVFDGDDIYSGSWDGTIRRWSLASGACTAIYRGHVDCARGMRGGRERGKGKALTASFVWSSCDMPVRSRRKARQRKRRSRAEDMEHSDGRMPRHTHRFG